MSRATVTDSSLNWTSEATFDQHLRWHQPPMCGTFPNSPMVGTEAALKRSGIVLFAFLSSCHGCVERTPNVCCTSDTECARLGLPPGSASEWGCSQGHICKDFYCVPEGDAPTDVRAGRCNPNAPFDSPRRVFATSSVHETELALMGDELSAFAIRDFELQMTSRTSVEDDFPLPTATGLGLEAIQGYEGVSSAPDGLTVYLTSAASTALVGVSYRPTNSSAFTSPSPVDVEGSPLSSARARLSADSMTLYWSDASHALNQARRIDGTRDSFTVPMVVTTLAVTDFAISADELTLFWSYSPGADIYVSTRTSKYMPFGSGVPVENVNSSADDVPLFVTREGCELYFRSNRTSFESIWVARRPQ